MESEEVEEKFTLVSVYPNDKGEIVRTKVYPDLSKYALKKSDVLTNTMGFSNADHEIELNYSPDVVFSIGQYLQYDILDSMVKNYGYLVTAFDFLNLLRLDIDEDEERNVLNDPKKLWSLLIKLNIEIPPEFPYEYRQKIIETILVEGRWFDLLFKLNVSEYDVQRYFSSSDGSDDKIWEYVDYNQFVKEALEIYKLDESIEFFGYHISELASNPGINTDIQVEDLKPAEYDAYILEQWNIYSEKYPMIYYFLALKDIRGGAPDVLRKPMGLHIRKMKNRKPIQSCIYCGEMAQFKTNDTKQIFVCSEICMRKYY